MTLEVLVATMNQSDFTLVEKMNIQSDVIFANQCEKNEFQKRDIQGKNVAMVSTDTRGVGKNRNFALLYAAADILLFSDSDLRYVNGYADMIFSEFKRCKDADAIIFSYNRTIQGKVVSQLNFKDKKLSFFNAFRVGTVCIAVKRASVKKYNIHFSELFGGGCKYGCGEDSLFMRDLFRNKCKVYSSSKILFDCEQGRSTWFTGYNPKFFYDKGAWIACAFPKSKHIIKWYFLFRFLSMSEIKLRDMIKETNRGIRGFEGLGLYSGM